MLTEKIEVLNTLFLYDPYTGNLTWKVDRGTNYVKGKEAGRLNGSGYKQVRVNKRLFLVHRVVWAMYYGVWPEEELDHINGNRVDNRIENLRAVSRHDNMKNKGLYKNNTSGIKGISQHKQSPTKWDARVRINNQLIHLGRFDSEQEAKEAYEKASDKLFGALKRKEI